MSWQTRTIGFGLTTLAAGLAACKLWGPKEDQRPQPPRCDGVPSFPYDEPPSDAYRGLVNAVLNEQGSGLEWKQDVGYPNIPDSFKDLSVQNFKKYATQAPGGAQLNWSSVDAALCRARQTVEQRRLVMVHAAALQMELVDSPTKDHLKEANPAEVAWLEATADGHQKIADEWFADQTSRRRKKIDAWMAKHGDPESRWHYDRIRTATLPSLMDKYTPKDFANPEGYASSVPWLPQMPSYNAMWPDNFSKEELEYVNKHFQPTDPIRLPYTVVDDSTAEEKQRLAKGAARTPKGLEYQWLVQGLKGRWLTVTNSLLHPRFRKYAVAAAEVNERYADISVPNPANPKEPFRLHPEFRKYTLEMARCFREGDAIGLLRADLQQSLGSLFFTFFPHEGYWEDNNKFAIMYESGIRHRPMMEKLARYSYVFPALNAEAREVAQSVGAPTPKDEAKAEEADRLVQVIWAYRLGGSARSFPGAVGGHDYPKYDYHQGLDHRAVVLADTYYAGFRFFRPFAEDLFPKELVERITPDLAVEVAFWHENSHGSAGNKPDTVMMGGKTFGEAYGLLWGAVAEPQADLAFVTAYRAMMEHGEEGVEERSATVQAYAMIRGARALKPKAKINQTFMEKAPHLLGSNLTFARAVREEGLRLPDGARIFQVDSSKGNAGLAALRRQLIAFGFQDKPAEYVKYVQDEINSLPDPVVARVLEAQKAYLNRYLVNRGDLRAIAR